MMLLFGVLICMLLNRAVSQCRLASCRDIYLTEDNPTSGEYTIETSDGQSVSVFCDFYYDRGYTFVSRDDLDKLTTLSDLYTENDHIIVRILYSNDEQHDVTMEQLTQYANTYTLSFQLSQTVGYKAPINTALGPYIFVGFLPESFATSFTTQGYRAAGMDNTFTNCDMNPNSYLAVFQNPGGLPEDDYHLTCCDTPHINAWIDNAQLIPANREMADKFYFPNHEIHKGGCGGYLSASSNAGTIDGVAIGLGFAITESTSTCTTIYCASCKSETKTCELPGACIITSLSIVKEFSNSVCLPDITYGTIDGSIWTDDCCRAKFRVCYTGVDIPVC